MTPDAPRTPEASRAAAALRRAAWICLSFAALLLLHSIWYQPVGWGPAAIAAALAVLAAARPFDALLVVSGVGPLATILLILSRRGSADLRFSEALILALVAGWSAHRAVRPSPLSVSRGLLWSAIPLSAAAAASAAVSVAAFLAQRPETPATTLAREIVRDYLAAAIPIAPAILFAEGLIVLLIAADTCAKSQERRDAVLRMMVAGAAGAAFINLLRIILAAASHGQPWALAADYFWSIRVNVQYGDLNAAGSYFAMMAFIAAGFLRKRGTLAIAALVLIAAALWLSGSRTALAGTAGVTVLWLAAVVAAKRRTGVLSLALGTVVLVTGALWHYYPHEKNAAAPLAWQIRLALGKAAVQMTADHPVFGVGLGRFYDLSAEYADVPGYPGLHENAHNNFLQVLAEMGAPAFVLFSLVIVLPLRELVRAGGSSRTTHFLLAGIAVFLITCLTGHPLLVHGAAYPFWIALGMAAAHGPAAMGRERRWRLVGIALIGVLAATLPFRVAAAVREANPDGASVGLSAWQHAPDGSRYRSAGTEATLFVSSAARAVEIPLRHGPEPAEDVEVRVLIDGREANAVLLPNDGQWHVVRLLPERRAHAAYSRIDLRVEAAAGRGSMDRATAAKNTLMVGEVLTRE